jgi:hypothetical protein
MQADVNILKEGLNLEKSSSVSQFRSVRERIEYKFENFDKHMTECKENDKSIKVKIAQLELDLNDMMEAPKENNHQLGHVDEGQLGNIMEKVKAELDLKMVILLSIINIGSD